MKRFATRLRWSALIIALVTYGALAFWAAPILVEASATGGQPFDLRTFGYGFADATSYIASLSASGRSFYLNEWRVLDTLFPVVLTLSFVLWNWRLLRRKGLILRVAFLVIGLSYGVFDFLENAAVAGMLSDPEGLTPKIVAEANRWTLLKFAVFGLSVLGILYGIGAQIMRRRR